MQSGHWQADLDVPPALFAAHMRTLVEGGYTVLTAGEVIQRLQGRREFPAKAVCITFDDGYRNNFTYAFSELQRCGFRASFFVVTDYIESGRRFAWLSNQRADGNVVQDPQVWEPMRWADIVEMSAAGMEVGSHSCTHAHFSELDPEEMRHEVSDSRRTLLMRLGDGVSRVFVCPFGAGRATAARLTKVLRESDFVGAFTGQAGAVDPRSDPFNLPRLTVYHDDSPAVFRRKVDGAYDWLMWFQPVWLRVTQSGRD
jgi:peptidoglycan/xylan/chitin deacetylase (PgdA/CDA1 family)